MGQLVSITISVKITCKYSISVQKNLQKIAVFLDSRLITSVINPFTDENLTNWLFNKLKHSIGVNQEIAVSIYYQDKQYSKDFKLTPANSVLGTSDIETYTKTTKPIRSTTNDAYKKAVRYLSTSDRIRLFTVLCPPYSKDWTTSQYKGFFNDIEVDPQTQDSWQYDYKHFFKVLNETSQIIASNFESKPSRVDVFIGDLMLNLNTFTPAEQQNLSLFIATCKKYLQQEEYNINIYSLASLQRSFQVLTKLSPMIETWDLFLVQATILYPVLKELRTLNSKDIFLILSSDSTIVKYVKEKGLGKDAIQILKCATQIERMEKVRVNTSKEALDRAILKYVTYKEFSSIIENNTSNKGVFISLDTGFTYAANFFETRNIPVLHIDPWKVSRTTYSYKRSTSSISIIIPVHNDKLLYNCLLSIYSIVSTNNLGDFENIEVILVANGDDTTTCKQLDVFNSMHKPHKSLTLRTISIKERGIAKARNVGVANSKYDIIGFIDADCELNPDYFQELSKHISLVQSAVILKGSIDFDTEPTNRLFAQIKYIRAYYNNVDHTRVYTPNLIMLKRTFYYVGNFNTHLRNGEDTEWDFRCKKLQVYTKYVESIRIKHTDTASFKKLLNNWGAYGFTRGYIVKNYNNNNIRNIVSVPFWHLLDYKHFLEKGGFVRLLLLLILDTFYFRKYFSSILFSTRGASSPLRSIEKCNSQQHNYEYFKLH